MFARTARLTLRPGWPEDAPALLGAINHRVVAEKLARVPWPYTLADAEDWLARPGSPGDQAMLICAHDLGDAPVLVGAIGLHPGDAGLELGYWLTPAAWGRGYATEAGRQVVAIARYALGVRRLAAYHHLDNPGSGHVLRKLGFREVGREPRGSVGRGRAVDSAVMQLDLDDDRCDEDGFAADRPDEVCLAA
jgi:RimJ/RimL family protein N-acetyltransferase